MLVRECRKAPRIDCFYDIEPSCINKLLHMLSLESSLCDLYVLKKDVSQDQGTVLSF